MNSGDFKARRKFPRLAAWGEYTSPSGAESEDAYRARLELMKTVSLVFPRMLEALATDVLPLYERAAAEGRLAQAGRDFEVVLCSDSPLPDILGALSEENGIQAALSKWRNDFHVTADWIAIGALRTLRLWSLSPESRKALRWDTWKSRQGCDWRLHGNPDPPLFLAGPSIDFSFKGWEPQTVTWQDYAAATHRELADRLAAYEKHVRGLAEARGLVRCRRQYSSQNLEWFALNKFEGLSSTQISQRLDGQVAESTILKGIKAAAILIEPAPEHEPEN